MPTQLLPEHERAALRRAAPTADQLADTEPTQHPLLTLQRQIGNAQVARMLAQRESMPEEEEELQMQRDPTLQRESMPEEEEELQMRRDPTLQREAELEEEELQMQRDGPEVGLAGGPISDQLAGRIQSKRGGGAALDDGTLTTMEDSFGTSFADVGIHTDSDSHQLNRSLGAQAFTTGSDIFFGPNGNPGDRELLAHELTHVVQQRSMSGSGPMTVGPADDSYEREANTAAAAVTSGAVPSTQRKTDEE